MHSTIYKQLSQYRDLAPEIVDSLIISSYLHFNVLQVQQNQLLLDHLIEITRNDELGGYLNELLGVIRNATEQFTIEDLIELFEFVVSPSDKVVNGAVYTPLFIRSLITDHLLDLTNVPIENCTVYDPATGCGGFLLTFAQAIRALTQRTYQEIFNEQIYGVDIADYSLNRARLLLSLQALIDGEDQNFEFNFRAENSLTFDPIAGFVAIQEAGGFDLVTGNPPYVSSRNMDEETLAMALNWRVSQTGHPDLYIPFFEIGINALKEDGFLGYITVNTFIKSINGRALRQYFEDEGINLKIINFGGEQIFADRNTYTCICILHRNDPEILYYRTNSGNVNDINLLPFNQFHYGELDHRDGWNLVNTRQLTDIIARIEQTGRPFRELFTTKNGIATLMNDVYKFRPVRTDELFHYFNDEGRDVQIETGLCRDVINANKIKNGDDIINLNERIIFPYRTVNGRLLIIPEAEMISDFPHAYAFLLDKRAALKTRDRGKKKYETWYAYGRRQSMDINAYKLFFPHICYKPTFTISENLELLFYNGIAIIGDDLREIKVLKRILESEIFFFYIKNTTKDYASGYISMSRNYLKNFGVPQLTVQEKSELLAATDINQYLYRFYNLTNEMLTINNRH